MWGSGSNDVYAVGQNGTIVHTSNQGASWESLQSGTQATLGGVWGTSAGNVYVAGYTVTLNPTTISGLVLHSIDGGGTWTPAVLTADDCLLTAIWGSAPNDLYAVGGSYIFHGDGTGAWTNEYTAAGGASLASVWGSSGSDIYVVGSNGAELLVHGTGGGNWSTVAVPPGVPGGNGGLSGVWGLGASYVVGVGAGGYVMQGSGTSWSAMLTGTNLNAAWASSPHDLFAIGDAGTIVHTSDGITWTTEVPPVSNNLFGIWGSGPGDVYVVGDTGTILHGD